MALLALTGCGGGAPDDGYGGPGASAYEQDQAPADLMGGQTAPSDDSGLAGGPRDFTGMDPIPNPENLPLPLRQQIYGHKFDHLKYRPLPGQTVVVQADVVPGAPLRSWRKPDGTLVVAMRPIANPEDMSPEERRLVYGKRYAPSASSAPRHGRNWLQPKPRLKSTTAVAAPVAPKAAPKVAAAPARPAPVPAKPVAVKPAPVAVPAPAAKSVTAPVTAKAPPADPKMAQLSAAVGPEAVKGAVLTVPDSLAKGEESKVTLSLPVNLLDLIQTEAGKLGLTKAAKKAEVSATLSGDGYTITPNAAQTQTLKSGEAATFDWNVKPGDGEKTPLKATVDGALTGQKGPARTFSLASLEQTVAQTVETAKSQARKWGLPSLDKLAIPGLKPIKVGDTVVSPGATTAGIIAFVLALILLAMARAGAGRRARAERRRKFRTMTDYNQTEAEAPESHASHTANPMAAAAGGFAAGSAAMTFAPSEDEAHGHDHGHGHVEAAHAAHDDHAHPHPAPDGHGHGDHGHDAHGHDAHAPAAEAHPEAHAAEAHAEAHPAPAPSDHGHADHGHADHGDHHAEVHHHREPEHA